MPTIAELCEAAEEFRNLFQEKEFLKSYYKKGKKERAMLLPFRFFFSGWFGKTLPEVSVRNPQLSTGKGRVDLCIGNTYLELAVAAPTALVDGIRFNSNKSELHKLFNAPGKGALILLDFRRRKDPVTRGIVREEYKRTPYAGKGNHKKKAINIIYVPPAGASFCVRVHYDKV